MGQPVVYENTAGQRKYLSFILKSSERGREDDPVVIALEYGTDIISILNPSIFQPKPTVRDQFVPFYH
jgi:hypothetical protein